MQQPVLPNFEKTWVVMPDWFNLCLRQTSENSGANVVHPKHLCSPAAMGMA